MPTLYGFTFRFSAMIDFPSRSEMIAAPATKISEKLEFSRTVVQCTLRKHFFELKQPETVFWFVGFMRSIEIYVFYQKAMPTTKHLPLLPWCLCLCLSLPIFGVKVHCAFVFVFVLFPICGVKVHCAFEMATLWPRKQEPTLTVGRLDLSLLFATRYNNLQYFTIFFTLLQYFTIFYNALQYFTIS